MTRMDFRDLIVAELGEEFAYSYFDRSAFTPGQPARLYPWSGIAEERWRTQATAFLKTHNVKLETRMAPGAWRNSMSEAA